MPLDFRLTDEQKQLVDAAQAAFTVIRERHAKLRASEIQRAALEDVWRALAELGFQGFVVPKAYGGSEKGLLASVLVLEQLGEAGLHSFLPILSSMDTVCIVKKGAEPLKQSILPDIASGELKLCFAATEEVAGFNVFNIKMFTEKQGDNYLVNGTKVYVSGLDIADYMLLVARTLTMEECRKQGLPKTHGLSLFMVDTKSKGLAKQAMPSRGEGVLTQFRLSLRDVKIPAEHLLGEEHGGAAVMFQAFNPERILSAAVATGVARYCLKLACDYAKKRKVFGDTAIGAYQSIQHPLAEVAMRIDALKWTTYRAAWQFDAGEKASAVAESANAAKFLSAEVVQKAVDAAIDCFGGKGFDEDYGVVHLLEFARFLKTSPISNALILNQTAEKVLGLKRSY
ncbi:acyl-CoA dehydrogenase [bacterium]|nr:MAG: acyl-CoA dehydrogenase [bacterium]